MTVLATVNLAFQSDQENPSHCNGKLYNQTHNRLINTVSQKNLKKKKKSTTIFDGETFGKKRQKIKHMKIERTEIPEMQCVRFKVMIIVISP